MKLGKEFQEIYNELHTCIWFFSQTHRKMVWANQRALSLFGASSLEALKSQSLDNMPEFSPEKLQELKSIKDHGIESVYEACTFKPYGEPISVVVFCQDIFNNDGDWIFCFEGQFSENSSVSTWEMHSLEAVRHTNVSICVVDFDGNTLMQNPSDRNNFGNSRFAKRFAEGRLFLEFKNTLKTHGTFSRRIKVLTNNGDRYFGMDARTTIDPITGNDCIVVNQTDLTQEVKAEKEAEEQRRIATVASLEIEQAEMKKDLELTKAVQELFFPKVSLLEQEGWTYGGRVIPASLCSGDWWWHCETPSSYLLFAADVTGHGAHSAMIAAAIAASLRSQITNYETVGMSNMLRKLNSDVYDLCQSRYYSTLTCVELHPSSSEANIYFQGAPPVYRFKNDGTVESMGKISSLIGVLPQDYASAQIQIDLDKGERLLLVSDGLVEELLPNETPFGERRLKQIFLDVMNKRADVAIDEALREFSKKLDKNSFDDDITIIAIDRTL